MKLPWARVFTVVLCILLGWHGRQCAESSEITPAAIASSARAAVVEVSVVRSTPNHVGTGAGFFVSRDGEVLTDWHVIRDAATITVQTARGESFSALVLAEDPQHDLAVLGITGNDFPTLQLSDAGSPVPGAGIALIGAGAFPSQEGRAGVIRERVGRSMLQISIPLRPGYSGSPLIDEQGCVIGIANGQYVGATAAQDENYAVPVAAIRRLLAHHALAPALHPEGYRLGFFSEN